MEISNSSMLMTMNRLASEASLENNANLTKRSANTFSHVVTSLDQTQKAALNAKKGLIENRPDTSMAEVLEKSSEAQVSMAAAIEIRNKMLEAYTTLSNMPI